MKGKNVTIFGLGAIGGFIGGKCVCILQNVTFQTNQKSTY